jgi:hypothetical protein
VSALAGIELPAAMQQEEAVGPVGAGTVPLVEPIHTLHGDGQQFGIVGTFGVIGVEPVGQQREVEFTFGVGEVVDFWRVEEIQPGHLLRMRAEMALPGRAWLQYEVREVPSGSMIHQTALFDPTGVFGRVYWYFMWPFHQFVFGGTLRSICRLAREEERQRDAVATTR